MAEEDDSVTEALEAPEVTEEIVVERLYTIPLGKAYDAVRKKRAKRAVTMVRAFIIRHMKVEEKEDLSIDPVLNDCQGAKEVEFTCKYQCQPMSLFIF